jgi:hypothetical protein
VLWGVSWFPSWPSCGGTTAGGCQQCVVWVRERSGAEACSAWPTYVESPSPPKKGSCRARGLIGVEAAAVRVPLLCISPL